MLAPSPGQTFADATAGLGGHARTIAERLAPGGSVVLNDADPENLSRARAVLAGVPGVSVHAIHGNFAELPRRMTETGVAADMVLADLGVASPQLDDAARGFSFSRDGPLDMRLDPRLATSAADLVNTLPEAELARIIREYGEDRDAARIARKIVRERGLGPIVTTARLAGVVRSASSAPRRGDGTGGIDPATRTFQALRIAVNDELGSLEAFLHAISTDARSLAAGSPGRWLRPGARVVIIAFHSLEDRPVKLAFNHLVAAEIATDLSGGAVTPGDEELRRNPRARSARLRAIRLVSP